MKIKRLYKWQLYLIAFLLAFIFFIFGAVLATFLYMKNLDFGNVRRDQKYLIQQVEEIKKEREQIMYIFKERGLIREHNEQVIKPGKEEK